VKRVAARLLLSAALAFTVAQSGLHAHVGSPDIFLDAHAGPHRVFVTIRPPYAIPGIAEVEVLTTSDDVKEVRIVPLPLTGPGAKFAPIPDVAKRSADDSRLFTGSLWMMTAGAWQVRVRVIGDRGEGELSVPVPTLPNATLAMSPALGVVLAVLVLVLCCGFVAIVATITRDAGLPPGELADARRKRRGRIVGAVAAAVMVAAVFFGNMWWGVEASNYSRIVYRPLDVAPTINNSKLQLVLSDPGWLRSRRVDDFVLDHGHPMHLFLVTPELDRLWHLHPSSNGSGTFEQPLPSMPSGRYHLFGDLVHRTGVSETVTTTIDTPELAGTPLTGDDSGWAAADVPHSRIVWVDPPRLVPKRLTMFTFRVEDEMSQPAQDLELYMGMPGHAVFIKRDLSTFAHVHPSGSAPMASLQLADARAATHASHGGVLPATVTFPYGFPEPGDYRIFVQIKRGGRVITNSFDAHVE
jgi:hypothetical protein